MTRLGVLTSSRADYSIYRPLLEYFRDHTDWMTGVLAFGTHLSQEYGYTISAIEKDGFTIDECLDTMTGDTTPGGVSRSMAKTIEAFVPVWQRAEYDFVLALGDRFEMFAAVASSVPFNVRIGHIAGGETTLGAIDDAFRHSITHMSTLHFAAAEEYRKRVVQLLGTDKGVYWTGALSVDNLIRAKWIGPEEFKMRWGVDLLMPYVLITVHPETVSFEKNQAHMEELINALEQIDGYEFVVTMPNADTQGTIIRNLWHQFASRNTHVHLVENFGTEGYMTAMRHCAFMMGNTSSGFVEAEFFPKPVINLGERQRGRILTYNIMNCPFRADQILASVGKVSRMDALVRTGIYGDGNAALTIAETIRNYLGITLRA